MRFFLSWSADGTVSDPRGGVFVTRGFLDETLQGDVVVPYFRVTIPNFYGFYNANRYATLSYQPEPGQDFIILARGRLNQLPVDMGGELMELEFTCVPLDEDEVLKEAANDLRVGEIDYDGASDTQKLAAERYDPLFFTPESADDPFSVLAARPDVWAWDRVNNSIGLRTFAELTTIHNIGDGGIEGTLRVSPLDPPRKSSKLRLVASWTQKAKGLQTFPVGATQQILSTYTYDDFLAAFPEPGTPVGSNSGWSLGEAKILEVNPQPPEAFTAGPDYVNGDADVSLVQVLLAPKSIAWHLRLAYDYQQQREEVLDISLPAEVQDMLGDDREETVEVIQLGALNEDLITPLWGQEDPDTLALPVYSVGDKAQANGEVWECIETPPSDDVEKGAFRTGGWTQIGATWTYVKWWQRADKQAALKNPKAARYFDLDGSSRGERTIRHGVRRLMRRAIRNALCVEVSFEVPFERAVSMRVGHYATITNNRLTYGTARGWISSVRLVMDGHILKGMVTMLCSIGVFAASLDTVPDYDLTGRAPHVPVNVNDLPGRAPRQIIIDNVAAQQAIAGHSSSDPVAAIAAKPTSIYLEVAPLVEEDLLRRRLKVECDPLSIRQDITLGGIRPGS